MCAKQTRNDNNKDDVMNLSCYLVWKWIGIVHRSIDNNDCNSSDLHQALLLRDTWHRAWNCDQRRKKKCFSDFNIINFWQNVPCALLLLFLLSLQASKNCSFTLVWFFAWVFPAGRRKNFTLMTLKVTQASSGCFFRDLREFMNTQINRWTRHWFQVNCWTKKKCWI